MEHTVGREESREGPRGAREMCLNEHTASKVRTRGFTSLSFYASIERALLLSLCADVCAECSGGELGNNVGGSRALHVASGRPPPAVKVRGGGLHLPLA